MPLDLLKAQGLGRYLRLFGKSAAAPAREAASPRPARVTATLGGGCHLGLVDSRVPALEELHEQSTGVGQLLGCVFLPTHFGGNKAPDLALPVPDRSASTAPTADIATRPHPAVAARRNRRGDGDR